SSTTFFEIPELIAFFLKSLIHKSNSVLLASNEEDEKTIKNIKKLIVIKFLSIFLNIINEEY
ncbi:MAG: hypothetical protein QF548_12305, partial [Acidimicrobiales bacterium]|nr:hypothetical protein [Acidimicrobiales bacterium]